MNNLSRKLATGISLVICSAAFLTGCSLTRNEHGLNPKDPQEVVVWHYYNGAQAVAFESAVTEFNNSVGVDKGIIVTAQSKSGITELTEALSSSSKQEVGAEPMPNIFQCYPDMAVSLDEEGFLTDLNQYIDTKDREQYICNYVEEGILSEDGSWKLFPVAKATEVLALNKTDWDSFSQATGAAIESLSTWEGLAAAAEDYYNWSGGSSFFGRDALANYLIIGSRQLGAEIFQVEESRAQVNLDKEIMRRLWDNFYVPYIKGYYKHTGRYRSDDVKIGDILCCVCSTSGMTYFPKEVTRGNDDPYPIESLVLPVPNFEGTDPWAVQQGASMAVTTSESRAEYASVVFLKWFTEPERNTIYAFQSGYLPVTKEANSIEKADEYLKKSGLEIDEMNRETFRVGIEQVGNASLYTNRGFYGGDAARSILESSLRAAAEGDREKVLQAISAGVPEEEALEPYLSDSCFDTWFGQLSQQLNEICR